MFLLWELDGRAMQFKTVKQAVVHHLEVPFKHLVPTAKLVLFRLYITQKNNVYF